MIKKYLLGAGLIGAFIAYAIFRNNNSGTIAITPNGSTDNATSTPSSNSTTSTSDTSTSTLASGNTGNSGGGSGGSTGISGSGEGADEGGFGDGGDGDGGGRSRGTTGTGGTGGTTGGTGGTGATTGQYKNGTYTGSVSDAFYGSLQVVATVSGGKLTNITFPQSPSGGETTIINSRALPQLRQEALAAQSANVNAVSGATETSQAFVDSLSSALAKAKA